MKIIFVGTGSGKTSLKRHHSSIFLLTEYDNVLIDVGDGISRALLELDINFNDINNIIFTHHHADHWSGISSLITQMKLNERTKPLNIFTHKKLKDPLLGFLNASYLFFETLGFKVEITGYEFDIKYDVSGSISFTPKQNAHISKPMNLPGYEKVNFVSASLFIKAESKGIIFTSDIGSEKDLYLFEGNKADFMITETTHVSFDQIYSAYKKLAPWEVFLTHISDKDNNVIGNMVKNLGKGDRAVIHLAYDGMEIIN